MSDAVGGGASRSTDPASGTSAATDVSLREFLVVLINGVEQRSDLQFAAMRDAVTKAETAGEKRLEGFPQLFADTAELRALGEKLQAGIDRNRDDLDRLTERLDLTTGEAAGSKITKASLYAALAATATLVGLLVVLANYITAQ